MDGGLTPSPALAVALTLGEWQRVFRQLGEGSINQFLPLLQSMQGQIMAQLASSTPRGDETNGE
jgi:hypothetical protein